MDLITNGVIIDDALKYVERNKPDSNNKTSIQNVESISIGTKDKTVVL